MCFWSERKVTNETALRDYLCAFAATQLRGIARGMGVDSPTTKSKGELIDEIVEIAAGRKQPAEKSKRGAPVKGDAVDPTIFEKIKSFAGNYDIEQDRPNEVAVCIPHEQSAYEETLLSGYALYGDDGFLLYTGGKTCIPISDCGGFDVRVGDKLMCAKKPNGSAAVLSVNGRIDFEERPRYEQRIAKYPMDCCYLGGSGRDWLRLVDLFSPIGKGQRALLTMSRSSDRRSVFIQIGKALCRNSDVTLIFLCLDAAPEEAEELKTEFPETDFFITELGASAKEHVETAELAIERAKRLAELGQDAICLFDSLDVLSEACNALDIPSEPKRLLGTAHKITEGSVTILAAAENCREFEEGANAFLSFGVSAGELYYRPLESMTKRADRLIYDFYYLCARDLRNSDKDVTEYVLQFEDNEALVEHWRKNRK